MQLIERARAEGLEISTGVGVAIVTVMSLIAGLVTYIVRIGG